MRINFKFLVLGSLTLTFLLGYSFNDGFAKTNLNKIEKTNKIKAQVIEEYTKIKKTKKGLDAYVKEVEKKNEILKGKNRKNIVATITFDHPLTIDEFESFVKEYGIKPKQVQSRVLVDDKRITIATIYSKDLEQTVESIVEDLKEEHEGQDVEFVGYTDMYAFVQSKEIDDIEGDSSTFLLDTSADSEFIEGNNTVHPHALTWLLEDIRNN